MENSKIQLQLEADLKTAKAAARIWIRCIKEVFPVSNLIVSQSVNELVSLEYFSNVCSHFEDLADYILELTDSLPDPSQLSGCYQTIHYLLFGFRGTHDYGMMKTIYSLCLFPTRTSGVRPDLEAKVISDFVRIDNSYVVSQRGHHLNRILKKILKRSGYSEASLKAAFRFTFSSGSTSDVGKDIVNKIATVGIPYHLSKVVGKLGLDRYDLPLVAPFNSKGITVNKSYKTRRFIGMESLPNQYVQQGFKNALYSTLFSRGYFFRHCPLDQQEKRQRPLVQEGSLHNNYATIDLSEASDRQDYQLYKEVFAGTFLEELLECRSAYIDLPDGPHKLRKFASMGNALTFPLETIFFALVVHQSYELTGLNPWTSDYLVYGDDIILDTRCAQKLLPLLESYGCKINVSKSFYGNECFRESCGYFYYHGHDIGPLRISRKFKHGFSNEQLENHLDMIDRLSAHGFPQTSEWFANQCQKHYPSTAITSVKPLKEIPRFQDLGHKVSRVIETRRFTFSLTGQPSNKIRKFVPKRKLYSVVDPSTETRRLNEWLYRAQFRKSFPYEMIGPNLVLTQRALQIPEAPVVLRKTELRTALFL